MHSHFSEWTSLPARLKTASSALLLLQVPGVFSSLRQTTSQRFVFHQKVTNDSPLALDRREELIVADLGW
jgi:hypothetical protein